MRNLHTQVKVDRLPECSFHHHPNPSVERCSENGRAHYDGKTILGPWANMCTRHFRDLGVGLGLGRGQKLVLRAN